MTVGELKRALAGVDDELEVVTRVFDDSGDMTTIIVFDDEDACGVVDADHYFALDGEVWPDEEPGPDSNESGTFSRCVVN